jgi:hypothetical protein
MHGTFLGRLSHTLEEPALSVAAARLGRMNGDEQLLNGRVYGAEHDDPHTGPTPNWSADRWTVCCWTSTGGEPKKSTTAWPCPPNLDAGPAAAPCTTPAPANPAHRARV